MKHKQQTATEVTAGLDRHEVESALRRIEVLAATVAKFAADSDDLPAVEFADRASVLSDLLLAEIRREQYRLGFR